MAIAPTGAIYKSLSFDGEDSRNYGVYITGEAVYNAPERDVEMITIPGRNGSFALDNGRFQNIEVSYPAGIFADTEADFRQAVSDFRNFLCSRKGYVRLQDEYNPDEYRMAVYKSGLEVDPAMLKAGEFTITFDCKPQRWLTSGEELVEVGEWSDWDTESGAIVEIEASGTDAVKSLVADIEPIQDLHGYDKPWSGGADANLLDLDKATFIPSAYGMSISRSGDVVTISGTSTGSGNLSFALLNNYADDSLGGKGYVCQVFNVTSGYTVGNCWGFRTETEKSFAIRLDNITQGQSVNVSMKLSVAKTSQSSWTPYSNICPISGHTDVVVSVTGVNIWDEEWELGGFDANGDKDNLTDRIRSKNYISLIPSTNYFAQFPTGNGFVYYLYDASKTMCGVGTVFSPTVISIPSNAHYIRFRLGTGYGTTYNNDISINYPSTDTSYHAYNGDTYTTSLGTTVYGGSLDVTTGVLTVDRVTATYDGSENWTKYNGGSASAYAMEAPITNMKYEIQRATYISNYLEALSSVETWGNYDAFIAANGGGNIKTGIRSITTVEEWKAYLAQNPLQVVYELATPTTTTLTAQQIDLLLGTNNIWADTGDVTLEYGQNPNIIINPTLFESSPLLEVEGYGSIGFNGYDIELENVEIGNIPVTKTQAGNVYTLGGLSELAIGDEINIDSFAFTYEFVFNNQTLTSGGRGSGVTGSIFYITAEVDTHSVRLNLKFGPSNNRKFIYGTAETKAGSGYLTFNSLSLTVKVNASLAYDGDSTITFSYTPQTTITPTSSQLISQAMGDVSAYSTKPYDFGVIFCDTDIGEFYRIEGGEYISMNHVGDLGSDLPTLAPGTNTVTYDNTITDLKIKPRWWKV